MSTLCPQCQQTVDDDAVCCAELRVTWKCRGCGKLSTGFVMPYGRCYLCGGENERVEGRSDLDAAAVRVVEEAMQLELNMFHFYRLAMQQTENHRLNAVLEDLFHKEQEHLAELDAKYHVHLASELVDMPPDSSQRLGAWLFDGVDFSADTHVLAIYDRALEMERRTRDHFLARAESALPGKQREIYRELAAEEQDHVAILETEREEHLEE